MDIFGEAQKSFLTIIIVAAAMDFILGDPHSWPHPIIYIGRMISAYEKLVRRVFPNRLRLGGFLLAGFSVVTVAAAVSLLLHAAGMLGSWAVVTLLTYLLYTSLAAKCLKDEALKVYRSLLEGDIQKSRKLLSYLVGRDTSSLKPHEVTRAVVETVAENTIDGVLAPMFWIVAGALVGYPVQFVFIYKTVNTLDSMVGYIQEPYREIGFASAKLDDVLNYIPARIGSVLMVVAGGIAGFDASSGMRIMIRDRKNHKSPNCAYPEAAAAGLMNIRLGGTNTYFGETVYKPTIGDTKTEIVPNHIRGACRILYASQIGALIMAAMILGM
ncbi:adenosylcobinamide-phosphate synthase [Peptoclostridium litorale DSM 5388]|uniref:Cobalamin biosynthesis protein CobD n=1 Tax=Peptoclostridium litorale DSM 5388 TaxID=1121324 RepID=A0A069RK44_PEPLI|nr:adenosylcobinamide-phosphate synthase CbiB [Peptoclostridium litorale]KDR96505.1 cobalamin biosynthesis protein CobD [Peptoclostridium litorale DSM 5388]SIN69811.1 adenosylcobinamide-phosphate synthase [Peptoclostridium litorale DSM 5388]